MLSWAAPSAAQQNSLLVQWGSNASEYRGQIGRRITVICPGGGHAGDVYGTDVYTDDSLICPAAVHAGLIGFANGGAVTFIVAPGDSVYRASARHGVSSRAFGSWHGSYRFDRDGGAGQIDWKTTARGLTTAIAGPLTLICPPNGGLETVWGTDTYTDDSSICTAAVHAGVINVEAGGAVSLQPVGAVQSYVASSRNGVPSREYGAWPNAFSVAGGVVVAAVPVADAPAVAAVAPRSTSAAAASSPSQPTITASPTVNSATVAKRRPAAGGVAPRAGTGLTDEPAPSALAAPTGVVASSLPAGQVKLTWNAVPEAALYHILYRTVGASEWYALTDRPGDKLPTVTQYTSSPDFVVLPAGTLEFTVFGSRDANDFSGQRSAPTRLGIARYDGRYRVTVNGFRVNHESVDANANVGYNTMKMTEDGKGDEIFVVVDYQEFKADGTPADVKRQARSKTHGDRNHPEWQKAGTELYRVQAGSASAMGGLRTGDGFPNQADPWRDVGGYSNLSFPLFVWEGYLKAGEGKIVITPVIIEDDREPNGLDRLGQPLRESYNMVGFPEYPKPEERKYIELTFAEAERVVSVKDPNSDLPVGVIPVRYQSPVNGSLVVGFQPYAADYTLFIRVTRIQ
jgi:hypothetical protein